MLAEISLWSILELSDWSKVVVEGEEEEWSDYKFSFYPSYFA